MAIDTHEKKIYMIDSDNFFETGLPIPSGDSVISQGDRQHFLLSYSGLLWAALSQTKGAKVYHWQWNYYGSD